MTFDIFNNNKVKELQAQVTKLSAKPTFVEIGATGTEIFSGRIIEEEYLTKLQSPEDAYDAYDKMRRSDAQVKGTLNAIFLPVRGANWFVEPASDSSADVEIAKLLEKNLLEEMSITWDDCLRQILNYLTFGYSVFEKVWYVKEHKGNSFIMIRKLAPRVQKTIWKWQRDENGGLAGVEQWVQKPTKYGDGNFTTVPIPVEKLLVFTNEQEGSNFEGISILRSAYKHWFIKDTLYKIDAIGHDRFSTGVPYAKEPASPDSGDRTAVNTIMENMFSREKARLRIPFGWEMGILEKTGSNESIIKSIHHHNEEIAKNVLAQFINLGTTGSGSRALGESFEELFMTSLNTIAGYIEDVINRHLIKQWVDYNWKVKEYPRLSHQRIILNVYKYLESISKMTQSGNITPDIESENKIRSFLGMPQINVDEKENIVVKKNNVTEKEKEQNKEPESKEEHENCDCGIELKEKKKWRELTEWEVLFADIPKIEDTLDKAETRMINKITAVRKKVVENVAKQVINKTASEIKAPHMAEMASVILGEMKRVYRFGKNHVKEELLLQKNAVQNKEMTTVITNQFNAEVVDDEQIYENLKEMARADAKILNEKVVSLSLYTFYSLPAGLNKQQAVTQIISEVNSVGETDIKKVAGQSINKAYSEGRENEAVENKDIIQKQVYSAVLDGMVCMDCLPKDGVVHDIGDPVFMVPNSGCFGKSACRCLNINVTDGSSLDDFVTKTKSQYAIDKKAANEVIKYQNNTDTNAPNYKWGSKAEKRNNIVDKQISKY